MQPPLPLLRKVERGQLACVGHFVLVLLAGTPVGKQLLFGRDRREEGQRCHRGPRADLRGPDSAVRKPLGEVTKACAASHTALVERQPIRGQISRTLARSSITASGLKLYAR